MRAFVQRSFMTVVASFFGYMGIAKAGVIDDAPSIAELFLNGLQMILSIVAVVAVVALVITGIMYIASSGDVGRTEQSKKMLVGSVTGLVIALLALVIVNVLSKLVS